MSSPRDFKCWMSIRTAFTAVPQRATASSIKPVKADFQPPWHVHAMQTRACACASFQPTRLEVEAGACVTGRLLHAFSFHREKYNTVRKKRKHAQPHLALQQWPQHAPAQAAASQQPCEWGHLMT